MDSRLKIFIIMAAVLIAGGVVAGIVNMKQEAVVGVPKIVLKETSYDFGTISMADGLARHNFSIKNDGDGNLILSNIKTSCVCTSAVLEVAGNKSPSFGMHNNPLTWSQSLEPGQEAILEVTYDPNAHGPDATGPITRQIVMFNNDNNQQNQRTIFTISADVTK